MSAHHSAGLYIGIIQLVELTHVNKISEGIQ